TQTIDLKLSLGSFEETVLVSGEAPQVDLTSAQVGGRISLGEVQAIPSVSKNLIGFLQVVPGVQYLPAASKPSTEGVTVNGQSAGIRYYFDGGSITGSVFNGGTGTRVMVPAEVVQEVVAITTQMPAEYGGGTGAVINTISKQGTNAYRGSIYGFFG